MGEMFFYLASKCRLNFLYAKYEYFCVCVCVFLGINKTLLDCFLEIHPE